MRFIDDKQTRRKEAARSEVAGLLVVNGQLSVRWADLRWGPLPTRALSPQAVRSPNLGRLDLGPRPLPRPKTHNASRKQSGVTARALQDQRFTPPPAAGGLEPGGPLLDAAAPHTFHMNIILPRRDLLLLIARCCPAGGAAAARPLKPLFTTAAAQLYAESVVDGLKALCALWLADADPAEREFCEVSGVRGAEQLRAFFDCPVISTMYHHNLGADDDTLLLPGTQERPSKSLGKVRPAPAASLTHSRAHIAWMVEAPVQPALPLISCCSPASCSARVPVVMLAWRCTWRCAHAVQNAAQGWLFGTHRPEATLHAATWRLSRGALLILDDTAPVWRECDQPLLLLIRRAPPLRELPSLDGLAYLAQLADRYCGGDCAENAQGRVVRSRTSELDRASARLHNVVEYLRGGHAPDDADVLLRLSAHEWSRLREVERGAALAREWWRAREAALQGDLARRQKRVAELEAEVAALKRLRPGQAAVGAAVLS